MNIKTKLSLILTLAVSMSASANWTYTSQDGFQIRTNGPFDYQFQCEFARNHDYNDQDGWQPYGACTYNGGPDIDPTYTPVYPGPGGHQTPIIPIFPYPVPWPSCEFIDC